MAIGTLSNGESGLSCRTKINLGLARIDATTPENTFVISPTGGDYSTIQAALTAQTSGGELFLVYPGTYTNDTINFTANNQAIVGVGTTIRQQITNTTTICDFGAFTNCSLENLNLSMTCTTAQNMITGSGSLRIRYCKLDTTATGTIAGTVCSICSSGSVTVEQGRIIYNNAAVSAGQIKTVCNAQAGASIKLNEVQVEATGSNASSVLTLGYSTGTGVFDIERCTISVEDTDATVVVGFADVTGSGEEKFEYNYLEVTCGGVGTTAYGILATSATSLTARSMYNHINVSDGGGSSYGFSVGANVTIVSQFDDVVAADGNQVTGTFTQVNSPSDGDLTISGDGIFDKIGIGTTSPGQALDVVGSIEIEDTTTSTTGVIYKDSTAFFHNFHHPTGSTAIPNGGNLFIGESAGNFTTGSTATNVSHSSYNVAIGKESMENIRIGFENVAIGFRTLRACQDGAYNLALGTNALVAGTASRNVAMGAGSLQNFTTGANSIALGYNSGRYITSGAVNQTSSESIYIGRDSRASADGNTNEIVIGDSSRGNGSNTVTLGNSSITDTYVIGDLHLDDIKSGATQVAAGAAAGELWKTASHATLPDNVILIGV